MKRKILALCVALVLTVAPIAAYAAPDFSNSLFKRGKEAVNLIAYGDFSKAIEKLAFSSDAPSGSDLSTFVEEELSDIYTGTVQTNVAVAYYINDRWVLAIPVNEPSYDSVQVLLLSSVDGQSFDAYRASSWKNVQSNVEKSTDVIWNVAYEPELPSIFVDN